MGGVGLLDIASCNFRGHIIRYLLKNSPFLGICGHTSRYLLIFIENGTYLPEIAEPMSAKDIKSGLFSKLADPMSAFKKLQP